MNVLRLLKRNNLLLITIILVLITLLLNNRYYTKEELAFDFSYFLETLYQKENELKENMNQVAKWLNENDEKYLFLEKKAKLEKKLSENGLHLLVYKNDSLKFWTDNYFVIPNNVNQFRDEERVVLLGNTWFLTNKLINENITIIGLVMLKHSYNFENEFLKNEFHSDFLIPATTEIIRDKSANGIHIYNTSDQYLFTLKFNEKTDVSQNKRLVLLVFIILTFLIFFLYLVNIKINLHYKFTLITSFLILFRFILWKFQFPEILFSFEIFKPGLYESSGLTPSFGDFFLHAVFILLFAIIFYKYFTINTNISIKARKYSALLAVILVLNIIVFQLYKIIEDLIINSSITYEVYKLQEFTAYTLLGFIILTFFLISFLLLVIKLAEIVKTTVQFKFFLLWYIPLSILFFIVIKTSFSNYGILSIIILQVLCLTLIYIKYQLIYEFVSSVIIVALFSIFSFSIISDESIAKEKRQRKILASELAAEHDPIAELLLENVEKKILTDNQIVEYLNAKEFNFDELFDYIQKRYFVGFWTKYDLQITICTPNDSLLVQPDQKWAHCYDFFDTLINNQGNKLENADFYFLNNQSGQISYFGYFIFPYNDTEISLYIQLDSKLIAEELGYPELLYESKISLIQDYAKYSYAKYKQNKLISQNGSYLYSLNLNTYGEYNNEFTFFRLNRFDHLMYKINDQTAIIISKPTFTFFDGLISVSHLFVFFYLISLIINAVNNYKQNYKVRASFKRRIQFSMISVLLLSLLTIGGGTIIYNIKQYQVRHYKSISEKIQSVLVELKHKLGYEEYLDPEMNAYITSLLIKFSNVFYSDINLYNVEGNLFASSRQEIFDRNLTGRKMNPHAFAEVAVKKHVEFIHNECIGKLSFASAYVPFHNKAGDLLAYLNLPYFSKQKELSEEITTFVVAIINTYVLLILLTILIAIFISGQITRSLRLIQEKFKGIDFSKKSEQIYYKGNDEIGSLVNEYNRMVIELEEKADLLAKSERESAWREMAKQIAHEIKNPLTPMKLNVQLLEKLWIEKDENFEERLHKITQSLIEQINSLTLIANEFSGFAKMPGADNEVLNIIKKLKDSITLFENSTSIKFNYDFNDAEEINIFADREQILRVFNNLIKNSIQALADVKNPEVSINVSTTQDEVRVEFRDNGKGISVEMKDKLFQPSFTTKTSGMGLGLAIVKNTIESIGGKIWFETELNKGTSFFIELPVYVS